jgi:hypothetical protein
MKKLLPQTLQRTKAILIMAGLATALVSETFAAPTPTPTPKPKKRTSMTVPPVPPPATSVYSP